MNLISLIFCIIEIIVLLVVVRPDSWTDDDVVEKFYWTPRNDEENIQWEFFIIGKRVAWNVGKILCSSRYSLTRSFNEDETIDYTLTKHGNSTRTRRNEKINNPSRLAILENDDVRLWLSGMLSESNYRYDGLWIGGHRRDSKSNWTWIGTDEEKDELPMMSSIIANYPDWYKINYVPDENTKNCLIFDRMGHNLPALVPTDCQLRKPFLCSRIVTKKIPEKIVEGISVSVDGYRYTIFSVDEGEDGFTNENSAGVRRLNGGGVKWIDARLECRKRGQYLAMVMSNEAAKKIAFVMLKNRPSMESVWLGGWSTDGTDWTWSTTGFVLSSTQSSNSRYPPWLKGHPIASSRIDDYYQRHGRCLVLDRHLCPDHVSPVFLDLDCEKKRPFVCQDDIPDRRPLHENNVASLNRRIFMNNRILEFSTDRMTWNEGQAHCAKNNGTIASILDSKTLSTVLDRMTDLYLDHVWVGGRTLKTDGDWRWYDETGKVLTRKGIGIRVSWCLGDDESSLPKAEPDSCLNLDREGHGLPLFYGLTCNYTRQHVLCSHGNASSISLNSSIRSYDEKNYSSKLTKLEMENFASSDRRSFVQSSITTIKPESENFQEFTFPTIHNRTLSKDASSNGDNDGTKIFTSIGKKNGTMNVTNEFRFLKEEEDGRNATRGLEKIKQNKGGTRIADLDEETKELLVASGYNISDSDLIIGLELELVDLNENSTISGNSESPPTASDKYKKC